MKLFDEETHLLLAMQACDRLVGYIDLYGPDRWTDVESEFFIYKGVPVVLIYEVNHSQKDSVDYPYYGNLRFWKGYSETFCLRNDKVDGILLYAQKTSIGEVRGFKIFNKGIIAFRDSLTARENITHTIDYNYLRLKRFISGYFK